MFSQSGDVQPRINLHRAIIKNKKRQQQKQCLISLFALTNKRNQQSKKNRLSCISEDKRAKIN